ncbi:MAG: metallophosphoesterase family protein [Candidatus Lindowbacteria bacterium]|nr:metallophosphoesterase family protein [Candidatus Lindowbacteria bacterium]
MPIAVLSDIHSNVFALEAVLERLEKDEITDVIILGDIFGYYPWAAETYHLLKDQNIIAFIKGNHDVLVENELDLKKDSPLYYPLAQLNRSQLLREGPDAFEWLRNMGCASDFEHRGREIRLCHGTPDDPVEGSLYPDNTEVYNWFPSNGQILLLGHTHYPLKKECEGGVIFNPGSVGQPRDGNVESAYGILDLEKNTFEHHRVKYDVDSVTRILQNMKWNQYAIKALSKNYKGRLKL